MTDPYYFDTDCLSAFLWVRGESLIAKLYPGRVVLPAQVYDELKKVPHLLARVDNLKNSGDLTVESIMTGTAEAEDYCAMAISPSPGDRWIGKGEAAAIALAKNRGGILVSNNLKDVASYVTKFGLRHVTTGDIMLEALRAGLITRQEGDRLWLEMLKKKRKLPSATFSDYLNGT